ncbi:DNA primase [Thiotrichales bacterium 19S3-7]|nr:DNA primase [Thiotrichales bacterium 19S3-7]MCF6800981.1 DNA primase [Thiotrichales bacterium 19S3-11]
MNKGLIPRDFINQLVASTDIVDIISKSVPLKKRGINLTACCPFHDEKTPSFYVSPQKQIYHCFGCGAGGNVISFLKEYERLNFIETIEELALMQGLSIPYEANNQTNTTNATIKTTADNDAIKQLYDITDKANKLFRWQLKHHPNAPEAINYIKSRAISAETAQTFSLGFAPDQWRTLFNTFNTSYSIELLEKSGLIVQNSSGGHYDKFRKRLIFPIRNRQGKVIAFGARALNSEQKPKYLNSPETPIFHKSNEIYGLYEIRKLRINFDYLLVTEGYLDVISLHEHGFKHAVATLGTALTEQHIKRLFRETQTVIFAFDGDTAGQQAAMRALSMILPMLNQNRQAKFLTLPENEDPDSYIKAYGLKQFQTLVEGATSALEYTLECITTNSDSSADAKATMIEKAIDFLLKMDITHQLIFKQTLAKQIKLTPKQLDEAIKFHQKQTHHKAPSTQQHKPTIKPLRLIKERLSLEEKAIALILQQPQATATIEIPTKLTKDAKNSLDLLITLFKKAQHMPNTALLLDYMVELHPQQKQYLYAISAIDFPFLDLNEVETELNATFIKLNQKNDDILLSKLIEKSKHTHLNIQEKALLKQLLSRH